LNGFCPWVTGANDTKLLLVGACLDDGPADPSTQFARQILPLVSTDAEGVTVDPGFDLIALSETHTGRVHLQDVFVAQEDCVAGPVENALTTLTAGPSTGSYQSSALALGVSAGAIAYLREQVERRTDLMPGAKETRGAVTSSCGRMRIVWCCGQRKRRWSRPREPGSLAGIRSVVGVKKQCSF